MKLNLGSGISGSDALNIIAPPTIQYEINEKEKKIHITTIINQQEWKNIDICKDYKAHEHYDISEGIREADESIEEIWMGDFFEHLLRLKAKFVMQECFRVLKSGGQLRISLPDMAIVMPLWLKGEKEDDCAQLIWGDQDELYQKNSIPSSHFHGYTERSLTKLVTSVGFKNIKRIGIHKNWCELAIEAYK